MGVGPVLFTSAGQTSQHYIPGAYSRIDFAPSAEGGASVNNGVLLGDAEGGVPGLLYVFSSYADAAQTLKGGGLLDAIWHAFNPGGGYSPQEVGAVRVNSAVQASLTLSPLSLVSADYGLANNRIQVQISAGTLTGKKIQVQQDTNLFVQDNVALPAFTLIYTGVGTSPVVTVGSGVLTCAITGDTANSFTLDLVNTYKTVADLAAFFASKPAFNFVVQPGASVVLADDLDDATSVNISTVQTFSANLLAVTQALQGIPLIGTVTVVGTARTVPANTTGWVNFTGGSEGSYTITDFGNALTYLETQNVQFIGTCAEDAATHNLIMAHCEFMCGVTQKGERQFLVGGALGESVAQVVTRAQGLASDKGAICYPGFWAYDQNGNNVLWSPAFYAAKELGRQTALAINEPATRKAVAVLGWEVNLKNSDQESCIQNGIWCGVKTKDGQFVNVRSVTTYQANNLQQNEFSMMREALYVNADLRIALDNAIVGHPMTGGILAQVDAIVAMKLAGYSASGIFQAVGNSPGYWNYTRTYSGSVVTVTYECYLTPPTNFVFITSRMQVAVSAAA